MDEIKLEQRETLFSLLEDLSKTIRETFTGSREGIEVVDVDRYLHARDLLLLLFRTYDAEVYRVCFEERLSNRPCCEGVNNADC